MKCSTRSYIIITPLLLLALPLQAMAHDYWLGREGDDYVLYQGHLYSAHRGEERVPYNPDIVKGAHCATGATIHLPAQVAAYPVRFTGACAALYVETSSGYWSQTLTGTINKPKTEVNGALRSWRSEESIKNIDAWIPIVAAPLTAGFELVPLENPLALKPGDKLRVYAMWQGKPKSGVTIAYDGAPRGITGADGKLNVRIRHGGTQAVSASFEEPLNDAKADKLVRATILQFQLPEK